MLPFLHKLFTLLENLKFLAKRNFCHHFYDSSKYYHKWTSGKRLGGGHGQGNVLSFSFLYDYVGKQ